MPPDEVDCWTQQGGRASIYSMQDDMDFCRAFLAKSKAYHIDGSKLFVHGGIRPKSKVEDNDLHEIIWNRSMVKEAQYAVFSSDPVVEHYGEVFCGHTTTICNGRYEPCNYSNVWMIDTGASYDGSLSIIDVDTKEFWQSDRVVDLYPGETAR